MKTFRYRSATGARFSAAADRYERRAKLQEDVARSLARLVRTAWRAGSILEIGCGTGILTRMLVRRFPGARLEALDISPAMLKRAAASIPAGAKVRWRVMGAEDVRAVSRYDLVASSSALHWVMSLDRVWKRIHSSLKPGGRLAAALMVRGTLRRLRGLRNRIAPDKRPLADFPTVADVVRGVRRAGFSGVRKDVVDVSFRVPSGRALLEMLHEQGVTGGALSGRGLLLNRTELAALVDGLDRSASKHGVEVVYRVLYLVAQK